MLIYDTEIKRMIPAGKEKKDEKLDYCEGWDDFEGMGISCICAFSTVTGRYHVFMDDNLSEFQKLIDSEDVVIGYNNNKFDDQLLKANGLTVPEEKSYDLLKAIWVGAGLEPVYKGESHAGYGLDAMAKLNLGMAKTANGALAPKLYQEGEYGKLIDYCLTDVRMTHALYSLAVRTGHLKSSKTGVHIPVKGAM